MPTKPKIMVEQPMYGSPMLYGPMTCAPINEDGILFTFGAVARALGFVATRIQPDYPDCEALRHVEKDRWQKVRIEFEYESRNFHIHKHSPLQCDIIVCWIHNWKECPLEVIELKTVMQSPKIQEFLAKMAEWEIR
jgi:hypothetical protein